MTRLQWCSGTPKRGRVPELTYSSLTAKNTNTKKKHRTSYKSVNAACLSPPNVETRHRCYFCILCIAAIPQAAALGAVSREGGERVGTVCEVRMCGVEAHSYFLGYPDPEYFYRAWPKQAAVSTPAESCKLHPLFHKPRVRIEGHATEAK